MVLGGDEIGRTQHGNNNAYCQDNEISWFDWEHVDEPMLAFVARLVALRRSDPVLRRRNFFSGQAVHGSGRKDIAWFLPSGLEVGDHEWFDEAQRSLGMILNGDEIPDRDPRGRRIRGGTLMVLLHAGEEPVKWTLPSGWGDLWSVFADTAESDVTPSTRHHRAGEEITITGRSLLALLRV
jgi:glycogen operon protein